ncbi:hypothetical protein M758_8G111900 [Ceratodon purpureus]|nr:hypothetical protein M758_8G111900 [Ceratodon purpureus]
MARGAPGDASTGALAMVVAMAMQCLFEVDAGCVKEMLIRRKHKLTNQLLSSWSSSSPCSGPSLSLSPLRHLGSERCHVGYSQLPPWTVRDLNIVAYCLLAITNVSPSNVCWC